MIHILMLLFSIIVFLGQFVIQSSVISQVITLIIFCIVFIQVLYKHKIVFHPNVLFLVSFFTFLLGRILIGLITDKSFAQNEFFTTHVFSRQIQFSILISLQVALLGFFSGSVLSVNTEKRNYKKVGIPSKDLFKVVFWILFVFSAFSNCFVLYKTVSQVFSEGYLSLYVSPPLIPGIIHFFATLFTLAFAYIINCTTNSRHKKIGKGVFIILLFISLLTGGRGSFLINLLTYLFFAMRYNKKKLNILKLFFFGILFIFSMQIISSLRVNETVVQIDKMMSYFIWNQGTSISIQGYVLEHISRIPKNLMILFKTVLDPYLSLIGLNAPLNMASVMYQDVMKTYSLGHIVSYLVDSNKFSMGYGLGDCYISELYIIGGYPLIFLGSFFYSYFFTFFTRKARFNEYFSFFLYQMMPFYIFAPRWKFLGFIGNVNYLIKAMPLILLLCFLLRPYVMRRKSLA